MLAAIDPVWGVIAASTIAGISGLCIAAINNRRTRDVLTEMKPNGGSSMKDQLNRIESMQRQQTVDRLEDLVAHAEWKGRVEEYITEHTEQHRR